MKHIYRFLILIIFTNFCNQLSAQGIYLNSVGYLPDQMKIATVEPGIKKFKIVDAASGKVVSESATSDTIYQPDVARTVRYADFSKINKKGSYYLIANDSMKSPVFSISTDVYNSAFYTSYRAFYLWRCGTEVSGDHKGVHFSHEACHLKDGYLDSLGTPNTIKDGTGGWHDAGDYGKYVSNGAFTVGMMFYAWDHFNGKLKNYRFDLPETAKGYPDYLKEIKWETDWLLKMAYSDGSGKVSHKLTRTSFEAFVLPEMDSEKRYFTSWSTESTADFVAAMAQAARYFMPYDKEYAHKCLTAAKLSYRLLAEHPEQVFCRQRFNSGGYASLDEDDRLWAVAELWETTGEKEYLTDLEKRISAQQFKVDENWDWGDVSNLGVYTYLLSKREGRNPELLAEIKKQTIEIANNIVEKAKKDIFGRPLGSKYYWGCNGTIVRQVINLQVANMIQKNKKYTEASLDAISNVFGRNQYGRSFVTGLGYKPPMNPHDRRSGGDTETEPWPGYLVGGGNKSLDWKDELASYSTNEIAINWQAALVYALAGFIQ